SIVIAVSSRFELSRWCQGIPSFVDRSLVKCAESVHEHLAATAEYAVEATHVAWPPQGRHRPLSASCTCASARTRASRSGLSPPPPRAPSAGLVPRRRRARFLGMGGSRFRQTTTRSPYAGPAARVWTGKTCVTGDAARSEKSRKLRYFGRKRVLRRHP